MNSKNSASSILLFLELSYVSKSYPGLNFISFALALILSIMIAAFTDASSKLISSDVSVWLLS